VTCHRYLYTYGPQNLSIGHFSAQIGRMMQGEVVRFALPYAAGYARTGVMMHVCVCV
jgi:hypothetical protein